MLNVRIQPKGSGTAETSLSPKIIVVGVGGAGGNAVNNMISSDLQGVDFLVCNTDSQALDGSYCEQKVQLGANITGGLGAGAKPEIGQAAAEETIDEVLQYVEGANMAFITAGMGGGTGTGAAPVIARACRERGILTVGVVTKPFHFEGSRRMAQAEDGIDEMQQYVDTLIVIPNQNLFRVANEKTTFTEAFSMADSVLQAGVRGVTDLMVMPGLINLDFADVRSAMLEMGKAMMGTGESDGERRSIEAAEAAINNPLLDDVTMKGAKGVIINVTGGMDMTLFEVDEACNRIRDEVDPHANIIFGSTFDDKLEGLMRVSIVATGIDAEERKNFSTTRGSGGFTAGAPKTADVKVDRSQPNTAVAEKSSPAPVTQSATPPASMFHSTATNGPALPKAPSPISAPQTTDRQHSDAASTAGQTAASHEGTGETSSMQARIYNDAFIPPQPVMVTDREAYEQPVAQVKPTEQIVSSPSVEEERAEVGLTAQRTSGSMHRQSSGLELKPPVPGANATAKKQRKSASLFERFTNGILHHDRDEDETSEGTGSAGGSTGGMTMSRQSETQQGRLAIDTPQAQPSQKTSSEDELDIPAFLRRQAN